MTRHDIRTKQEADVTIHSAGKRGQEEEEVTVKEDRRRRRRRHYHNMHHDFS